MTEAFNKEELKARRRSLRNNMPKSEVILWSKLKNKQILGERFLSQYSVDQYVLDFYCPQLKLAIEVDGDSHFVTGTEKYDTERQEYIEAYGIRFLPASPAGGRFTNPEVCDNLDGVYLMIFEEIETIKKRDIGKITKK